MRSAQRKLARSNERAHLNRDELEAAPGAALAYPQGPGGWRGRPHREARPLQAPRWMSAALYKARYRVSEANELLRALKSQGGARLRSHCRRTQGRRPRGRLRPVGPSRKPARRVGAGAGRATRRGRPCAPRSGPEASRSQPVAPEETTDARAPPPHCARSRAGTAPGGKMICRHPSSP